MNTRLLSLCFRLFCSLVLLWMVVIAGHLSPAHARSKRVYYLWEDRSDGMYSLNAASITHDPKDPKRMYAASNGVFYISKDAGLTWTPTARFRGASRVQVDTIDVSTQIRRLKQQILEEKLEDLAAEVGEELAEEQRPVLEREAEEEAEERLRRQRRQLAASGGSRGRFSRFVYRIKVVPTDTRKVIVVTDGGAFLSTDKGRTFRQFYRGRGPGVGDVRCIAISPTNSKRIWIGTRGGLWQTKDGGGTWRRDGGMLRATAISEIKLDPHNPKIMYVAAPRSLFVSKNGGKSFLRIWTLVSGPDRIVTMTVLATKPTTVVIGTGSGLYYTTANKLRRFKRMRASGLTSRRIVYITSSPKAPKHLYVANDQGVFLSKNLGRRFKQLRAGMLTTTIRFLDVSPFNPEIIWAATDYGFLRWSKLIGRRVTKAQWARFMRKMRLEPTAWHLARESLKFFSMDAKLGALQDRYGARRWLPQLRVSAKLYFDRDQDGILLRGGGTLPVRLNEGRQFLFEVNLIWPLSGLINPQQTTIVGATTTLRKFRDKLIKQVNRLYHARRRLQMRLFVSPPKKLRLYLKRLLKKQEISAQLDALTGGYFYARMKRLRGK